jgi:hypothetical protein
MRRVVIMRGSYQSVESELKLHFKNWNKGLWGDNFTSVLLVALLLRFLRNTSSLIVEGDARQLRASVAPLPLVASRNQGIIAKCSPSVSGFLL